MKTIRMTTSAAIVKFLKNQFVSRDGQEHRIINGVFGIFGHGNVAGLGQALEEFGGSDLPFFQPKNEQAMVHAAIAFAKTKRGLGTYACTSSVGPGATNMVTGAATATINRLPVLLLPGDIFANRWPNPVLQQLEHAQSMDISVNDCFKPVSRFWDRIQRPEQILASLPEAMRVLSDPALTGAVTICLPEDVQAESYDFPESFFERRVYTSRRPLAVSSEIELAAKKIREAKAPLIVAGGGVLYSQAESSLLKFAERTKIPVCVTQAGKSALPDTHPLCLGAVGTTGTWAANRVAEDCDLVIALGTRLSDFTTASKTQFKNPTVQFIKVNINSYDSHKHGGIAMLGDIQAVLGQLETGLSNYVVPANYHLMVKQAKEDWLKKLGDIDQVRSPDIKVIAQSQIIRALNDFATTQSTIVHAAGSLPGDLHKLWISKSPGDYHSEYGYSCMGYEVAGALGVKMGAPDREVYAVLGDGSYLMLSQEIATSIQEGIKITVVLLDNSGYQCIHNLQRNCGGESFGNEFKFRDKEVQRLSGAKLNIDFCKNAESLGAKAFISRTVEEFKANLAAAKKEKNTCLIYTKVDPSFSIPGFSWWDVPIAETSEQTKVQQARAKYEEHLKQRQFYY